MKHEILIKKLPKNFSPAPNMLPFHIVRQEKMTLLVNNILTPSTVGIRYAGYFSYTGEGSEANALEALKYGLMTAQFHLSSATEIDFQPLFTERREELIAEANAALVQSESLFQLDEVVFGYVDYCVHDGSYGASTQRYSGFVIGQSATHNVTVHKPKGIPGEWQCVCGAYNAPGDKCEECGIARPVISVKQTADSEEKDTTTEAPESTDTKKVPARKRTSKKSSEQPASSETSTAQKKTRKKTKKADTDKE